MTSPYFHFAAETFRLQLEGMGSERAPAPPAMRGSPRPAEGYWTSCDVCAEVYWQPYGQTSREAHGGPYGHSHVTHDEGALEAAREEADLRNDLESIARAANDALPHDGRELDRFIGALSTDELELMLAADRLERLP